MERQQYGLSHDGNEREMKHKIYAAYCALLILGFMTANYRGYTASSLFRTEHRTQQDQNHYHK